MTQAEDPKAGKKPYTSPRLEEYGSVAKLTESKAGSTPDGKSGMTMSTGDGGACL